MTVRRNAVIPVAAPADEPRGIHRCYSCGVGLAKWPRQRRCSYCAGDPKAGADGYFDDIINEHIDTVLIPDTRGSVAGKLTHLPDGTACKNQKLARMAWYDYLSNRAVWVVGPAPHGD